MTTALFDISAHGSGHLAQSAPVIDQLAADIPGLELIIRSGIDTARLRARISTGFEHIEAPENFGLVMLSPFDVDREATVARYRDFHASIDARIDEIAETICKRHADVVISNIGYISLAAAARAGIPSVAFGSINWHGVLEHYCRGYEGMDEVLAAIASAYCRADFFLRLIPGMSMMDFDTEAISAPIVAVGRDRGAELRARLALPADAPIVAFGFDASAHTPPQTLLADPRLRAGEILLLGPGAWELNTPWLSFDEAGVSFLDALASATLAVAKPGYGLVTEAAAAGVPLLLLGRRDWPETSQFVSWVGERLPFLHLDVSLEALAWEDLLPMLGLRAQTRPARGLGGGEIEIARAIAGLIGAKRR